ncbi:ecto-ADP-ribosyltransferase 5-like isoform X2 [Malaclemys terrapin pileata]|uniref:ecto-ADP-ribosyltransferase 5-like isoform X2 n=1 Tax=Malaclemys terrapin pileata TaxID=2991368 RepID=UPI0023A88B34|nr:ecto-ADP-ribosyltransferase 5-like isoform X2 [Malaclemys terrapin pileata]
MLKSARCPLIYPLDLPSASQVSWEMKTLRSVVLSLASLWALALLETSQVRCQQAVQLGMAPDSFDDQYTGCTEEMETDIAPRLLEEEKARHPLLGSMWGNLSAVWAIKKKRLSVPEGFRDEHGIAILVYTDSSKPLYWELNKAVREAGVSRDNYMSNFHFKALHYYLTRALQLLRADCGHLFRRQLFRGVRSIRFEPSGAGMFRFGQFTSSSLDVALARSYGNATFFTLRSCFGVLIESFSAIPSEREVLIPGSEVFNVSSFSREGNRSVFFLHSMNRTCSHYNCAYLGGECRPALEREQARLGHLGTGTSQSQRKPLNGWPRCDPHLRREVSRMC